MAGGLAALFITKDSQRSSKTNTSPLKQYNALVMIDTFNIKEPLLLDTATAVARRRRHDGKGYQLKVTAVVPQFLRQQIAYQQNYGRRDGADQHNPWLRLPRQTWFCKGHSLSSQVRVQRCSETHHVRLSSYIRKRTPMKQIVTVPSCTPLQQYEYTAVKQ